MANKLIYLLMFLSLGGVAFWLFWSHFNMDLNSWEYAHLEQYITTDAIRVKAIGFAADGKITAHEAGKLKEMWSEQRRREVVMGLKHK